MEASSREPWLRWRPVVGLALPIAFFLSLPITCYSAECADPVRVCAGSCSTLLGIRTEGPIFIFAIASAVAVGLAAGAVVSLLVTSLSRGRPST